MRSEICAPLASREVWSREVHGFGNGEMICSCYQLLTSLSACFLDAFIWTNGISRELYLAHVDAAGTWAVCPVLAQVQHCSALPTPPLAEGGDQGREKRFLLIMNSRWWMTSGEDFIIRHALRDLLWGRFKLYQLGAQTVVWELEVGWCWGLYEQEGVWAMRHVEQQGFCAWWIQIVIWESIHIVPWPIPCARDVEHLQRYGSSAAVAKSTMLCKTSRHFSAYHGIAERRGQVFLSCEWFP